jgi:GAF domain-containing protein
MEENALDQYKLMVKEQGLALLDVMQSVAEGDLDVEIEVPEGIEVFSDLAIALGKMVENIRDMMTERVQLNRRYVNESWREHLLATKESATTSYLFEEQQLTPNPDLEQPEIDLVLQHSRTVTSSKRRALETSRAVAGPDEPVPAPYEANPNRSVIAVPISLQGHVVGALGIEDPTGERDWSKDDIALLEAVTTQLGLAMDNARLAEQTQASLAETARLYEAASRLSQANSAQEAVNILAQEVQSALGPVFNGSILLAGPDPAGRIDWLTKIAHWNPPEGATPIGTRLPIKDYPEWNRLIGQKQPLIVKDTESASKGEQTRTPVAENGARTIIAFPLIAGDSWLGVMNAVSQEQRTPGESLIRFLQNVADRAAVTMESLRLYEQTRRRAEREQLIRQVTDKVRATSDLETILQTTVRELSKAMGLPRTFVRLGTQEQLSASSRLDELTKRPNQE